MKHFTALAGLLALCAVRLEAQTIRPKAASNTQTATPAVIAGADIAITAGVSARELRFDQVGELKVEFPGFPNRQTVWEEERQNISRPARAGVTYRDIGSQLRIISRFSALDRLIAQALDGIAAPKVTSPASAPAFAPAFAPIPAPLPPIPVSMAPIPAPKPVLPVKPFPARR